MVNKIITSAVCILFGSLLVACITVVDDTLPYEQLPEITVATEVTLIASPSHPTSALPFAPIPAGATVQVIGTDQDTAWLLVLYKDKVGWLPTFFSRTNVATLPSAVVFEPLSGNCAKYMDATADLAQEWTSTTEGSLLVLGSLYRPQSATDFTDASLSIAIEGSGTVVDSDYIHTLLTPTSAIVFFAYKIDDLQKGDLLRFQIENLSNEPLAFQATFFHNECPQDLSRLPIGQIRIVGAKQSLTPKADTPSPIKLLATPTPVTILIEGGLRELFTLDLTTYDVGDIADDLGMDLVVNEEDGNRYLAGLDDHGRIELPNLNLQDNFEVTFIVDFSDSDSVVALQSDSGEEISIIFNDDIRFGNVSNNFNETWKSGEALNRCRLLVSGDTAKFYINDIFFATTTVEPGITYTRFIISDISQNEKVQHVAATQLSGEKTVQTEKKALIIEQEGFTVNLDAYEVGDVPEELGSDLLIHNMDNKRYITGLSSTGRIELQGIKLHNNFEITFIIDFNDSDSVVALESDTGEQISIVFGDEIKFGDKADNYNEPWKSGKVLNRCRLLVNGGTAKFYINDIFFGTAIVESGITYNKFVINNIGQDEKVQYIQAENL